MSDDRPEWADDDTDEPTPAVDPMPAAADVPDEQLVADEAAASYDPAVEGRDPA